MEQASPSFTGRWSPASNRGERARKLAGIGAVRQGLPEGLEGWIMKKYIL